MNRVVTFKKEKFYKYLYNIVEYITVLDCIYSGVLGYIGNKWVILGIDREYNLVVSNREYKVIRKTQKRGSGKGVKNRLYFWFICSLVEKPIFIW